MNQYIIKLIFIMAVFTPIYVILRRPWMHKGKRECFLAAFCLFHIALITLALQGKYQDLQSMIREAGSRISTMERVNLVPFQTIKGFFEHFEWDAFLVNIVGNIVMFMPWGFGLPLLWKRNQRWRRIVPMALGITLFIEVSQLFIGRSVDVDDLILNFMGGCLGAAAYFLLCRCCPKIKDYAEDDKGINMV